jgi:hypothetical protein
VLIEQQKVAIMPGYTYGEEGNGFVRLNAGCPRSKLEQGVQRLIAGINALCNQLRNGIFHCANSFLPRFVFIIWRTLTRKECDHD